MHFAEGRDFARAAHYHHQAGQIALRQHGYSEAADHLTRALDLLKALPDSQERTQQELTLQVMLGGALTALKGHASREVEQAYAQARELCEHVDDTPRLFPVLLALGWFYLVRGSQGAARDVGRRLLAMAEATRRSRDFPRRAPHAGLRVLLRRRVRDGARPSRAWDRAIRSGGTQPDPVVGVSPQRGYRHVLHAPRRLDTLGARVSGARGRPDAGGARAGPLDRSSIQPGPRLPLRRSLSPVSERARCQPGTGRAERGLVDRTWLRRRPHGGELPPGLGIR